MIEQLLKQLTLEEKASPAGRRRYGLIVINPGFRALRRITMVSTRVNLSLRTFPLPKDNRYNQGFE